MYSEIIKNLDEKKVIELMRQLGATEYVEKKDCIIFRTICHHEHESEGSMKLYYYKNSHMFYCYTECLSMSIFKLLKNYYEVQKIDYDWYNDILHVAETCTIKSSFDNFKKETAYSSLKEKYVNRKALKPLSIYSENILQTFQSYYPIEWLQDGITEKTMDKYNIKFSFSKNKIIIPHYNPYNQLIGIRSRNLDLWETENIGKYTPMQIEGKWYSHPLGLNLYGLNYTKDNIKRYGICYVGEGEKFCLQMESFNMPNLSVAVCGSNFNKFQLSLLMKNCMPKEIVLCFDKEQKNCLEEEYFLKLYNMAKKYKDYCRMSFIYDKNNLLNLKDSPTDKGEEIFKELLQTREIIR